MIPIDINDEAAIYQHINRMTLDISNLIENCNDNNLINEVMSKCESIMSMLYYLDDINEWMSKIKHKSQEGN